MNLEAALGWAAFCGALLWLMVTAALALTRWAERPPPAAARRFDLLVKGAATNPEPTEAELDAAKCAQLERQFRNSRL